MGCYVNRHTNKFAKVRKENRLKIEKVVINWRKKLKKGVAKPLNFTKKKKKQKYMKITICLLVIIKLKNQVFLPNTPSINWAKTKKFK